MMKNFNYQKTRAELDELLAWFESGEISVDKAIVQYQRAEELLKQLETYLSDTKAKIKQITNKLDN